MAAQSDSTRRGFAKSLVAVPVLGLAGVTVAGVSSPAGTVASLKERTAFAELTAEYCRLKNTRNRLLDRHSRREAVAWAKRGSPATVEAAYRLEAEAARALDLAGTRSDAVLIQLMATPSPDTNALRFKAERMAGEEYDYFSYALDDAALVSVFLADVLFHAGAGPRPSRQVLEGFLKERQEFIAGNDATSNERFSAAIEKASKERQTAETRSAIEDSLGKWLNAVDRGGGRLTDPKAGNRSPGWRLEWALLDEVGAGVLSASELVTVRRNRKRAVDSVEATRAACAALPEGAKLMSESVFALRRWNTYNRIVGAHIEKEVTARFKPHLRDVGGEQSETLLLGGADV